MTKSEWLLSRREGQIHCQSLLEIGSVVPLASGCLHDGSTHFVRGVQAFRAWLLSRCPFGSQAISPASEGKPVKH
jgi:hypothetical protein